MSPNPASRWLDARYAAHGARRDEAPPLVVAMAEAVEAERIGSALRSDPRAPLFSGAA